MLAIFSSSTPQGIRNRLDQVREREVALDTELIRTVSEIIDEVRRHGDAALIDYTARFDGVFLKAGSLRIQEADLIASAGKADARFILALRESISRIRKFHERQIEKSWDLEAQEEGVRLGQLLRPIERAGLYVPGGTASYPSSVIMNVVPAQVAGVERIVVVTPPRTLSENPAVAAALIELGVTEVYSVGGAQAIAALAFGTESVPRVDKITGPGNRYVAAAKKLVFGAVGIDSIAGPSEVVIVADDSADPAYVAADMLAQAEHSEDAAAIAICISEVTAAAVRRELEVQLEGLSRRSIAEQSLNRFGAVFVVPDAEAACALANELAPEHLELMVRNPEELLGSVRHAGAVFLGAYTPEAVGDYFGGPNHVLPTGGAVRFSSALGVYDFVRRMSVLSYSKNEISNTAEMIAALAEAEGLDAHAKSALIRLKTK
jgi:histidinol dehydrogenase